MHYMTANPDDLRAAYREMRELAHRGARIAQHGRRSARRVARGTGYALDQVELIERIADKRGIPLTAPRGE